MRKLMLLVAVSTLITTGLAASAQAQCTNCQTGNRNWTGQPPVDAARQQRDRWSGGAQRNCVQNGVCPR